MDEVKIGEILEPGSDDEQARRESKVRARIWDTLRKAARYIPFLDEVLAGYYCALDPQTPLRVRGILLAALAYFVMPFDVIPDFLAGIGFTDDMAVLLAALSAVRGNITPAHRAAARAALARLDDGAPDSGRA